MSTTSSVESQTPVAKRSCPGFRACLFVAGLLLLALALRLYRLNAPPMDFHPVRQYIGAIVARAYFFEHRASVSGSRRELARVAKETEPVLEPRVLPWLASLGYRATGGERLWIPRLVSIFCCW